jgi:hypothetical protein
MDGAYQLTTEERARIEEIQDLLIERYIALRDAHRKDHNIRARKIEIEINELRREIEEIKEWAKV